MKSVKIRVGAFEVEVPPETYGPIGAIPETTYDAAMWRAHIKVHKHPFEMMADGNIITIHTSISGQSVRQSCTERIWDVILPIEVFGKIKCAWAKEIMKHCQVKPKLKLSSTVDYTVDYMDSKRRKTGWSSPPGHDAKIFFVLGECFLGKEADELMEIVGRGL